VDSLSTKPTRPLRPRTPDQVSPERLRWFSVILFAVQSRWAECIAVLSIPRRKRDRLEAQRKRPGLAAQLARKLVDACFAASPPVEAMPRELAERRIRSALNDMKRRPRRSEHLAVALAAGVLGCDARTIRRNTAVEHAQDGSIRGVFFLGVRPLPRLLRRIDPVTGKRLMGPPWKSYAKGTKQRSRRSTSIRA
jgi:hypothetical protein